MSIELTFKKVPAAGFVSGEQHTWPLKVIAVSNEPGLPSEIFKWHANAADVIDDTINPFKGDRCEAVASVHDLSVVSVVDDPEDLSGQLRTPFYRASIALFHCKNQVEADQLKAKIQADVLDLLENFRAASNLEDDDVVEVVSP